MREQSLTSFQLADLFIVSLLVCKQCANHYQTHSKLLLNIIVDYCAPVKWKKCCGKWKKWRNRKNTNKLKKSRERERNATKSTTNDTYSVNKNSLATSSFNIQQSKFGKYVTQWIYLFECFYTRNSWLDVSNEKNRKKILNSNTLINRDFINFFYLQFGCVCVKRRKRSEGKKTATRIKWKMKNC